MTDLEPSLQLADRPGLPDDIAIQRARYPRPGWPEHANYGELAAFWRSVHDSLRQEGEALAATTLELRAGTLAAPAFQQRFTAQLSHHLQHLSGHHQIEDDHYFPRFRLLDRRLARGFDVLDKDHDVLHDTMMQVASTGRALMHELTRSPSAGQYAADRYADEAERLLYLLDRHLYDEEDLVIPAMLEHGERALMR